ncbi:MAG: hypothetical protein QXI70_08065, partial [Methanothrix sp.]
MRLAEPGGSSIGDFLSGLKAGASCASTRFDFVEASRLHRKPSKPFDEVEGFIDPVIRYAS